VIVADTSAWIELLRGTSSPPHRTLARLIEEKAEVAITEVVLAELLSGVAGASEARTLRRMLLRFQLLTLRGLIGFEAAAHLGRHCRRNGVTASLTDCLVAAPTMLVRARLLHADSDFDRMARVSALEVFPPDA
jgi:predicted nucleic acid-binding protein